MLHPLPPHPCFANSFRDRDTRLTLFDPVMKIYGYFSYFLITIASNSCILNRFVVIRRVSMLPGFFFFFFFPSSTGPVSVHRLMCTSVVLVTLVLGIMRDIYIIDFRNGIIKMKNCLGII